MSALGDWSTLMGSSAAAMTHMLIGIFPTQGPKFAPGTTTCIFCRWVQICYGYGPWQSVCLGYPKQSSFKDIHGNSQVRQQRPASTIPAIQQWKSGKETLVYVEVRLMFTFWYPYISNRWSELLAQLFILSWHYSCDRCDVVWDGRNSSLKVRKPWNIHRSAVTFLRSKRGNSVRWTWRDTLWVGPEEKWAWSRMVDRRVVGCSLRAEIIFIMPSLVH